MSQRCRCTDLPQDGKQSVVYRAGLGDLVDGVDDDSRRGSRPAEVCRPEPLGVDPDEAAPPVVVDQRRDDEFRQRGRIDADVPVVVAGSASTPKVDNYPLIISLSHAQ